MAQKPSAKLQKYRLIPMRELAYAFEIASKSPEGAGKRLQERLKRDAGFGSSNSYKEPGDAVLFGHSWFPPDEVGYIISGGDLPEDLTGKTCHVWDGKKITRKKLSD